jgi:hypothetical protein
MCVLEFIVLAPLSLQIPLFAGSALITPILVDEISQLFGT